MCLVFFMVHFEVQKNEPNKTIILVIKISFIFGSTKVHFDSIAAHRNYGRIIRNPYTE